MVKGALVYLLAAVALVVGMWFTSFVGLWGFDPEGRPSDGCVFWAWYWGPDDCPIRAFPVAAVNPSTSPTATAEPRQTPEQTSAPTLTPQPAPDATGTPDTQSPRPDALLFDEFDTHWNTAPDSDLTDDLMAALVTYDPAQYQPAARELLAWAESELEWLDDHPAAACYGDIHANWRQAVVHVVDATSLFAVTAPDNQSAMATASAFMVSYLELLTDMLADLDARPCGEL